ncbi:hypothetical protein RFI_09116 [Reticulomyxa filosa]|uniref:RGS domain-containing protein n=1 Tax=Reticulomyxa filosa TaxID=46433 RepID=X6NRQ2_RETFI|nr:hypothetical protein RFI_09116 [Reticulomyxa filosa]|eukprot:ETO28017.1 hypothetical protein RFI_09116 [Reticulomyxa filosa]
MKLPVFEDMIFFRGEIRWSMSIIGTALAMYCVLEISFGPKVQFAKNICIAWVYFFMEGGLIFIKSRWVLHKMQNKLKSLTQPYDNSEPIAEASASSSPHCPCLSVLVIPPLFPSLMAPFHQHIDTNSSKNASPFPLISFEQLLRDENGIELFMKHLNKEFCMGKCFFFFFFLESSFAKHREIDSYVQYNFVFVLKNKIKKKEIMLSLIEMAQFQQYMLKVFPFLKASESCLSRNNLQLPDTLPQSMLLYDKEFIDDDVNMFLSLTSENSVVHPNLSVIDKPFLYCKVAAFHLFQRYIAVGSELISSILFFVGCNNKSKNIHKAGKERTKLIGLIENKRLWMSNKYVRHRSFGQSVLSSLSLRTTIGSFEDKTESYAESITPVITPEALFLLFDPSLSEMITLLRHAFFRFQNNVEYIRYCQKTDQAANSSFQNLRH